MSILLPPTFSSFFATMPSRSLQEAWEKCLETLLREGLEILAREQLEMATENLRRLSRDSLIEFTRLTLPRYRPGRHHWLIAGHLEAVARGEIDRLMIFLPPRHGKSELASRRFPAWYLGRHPDREIIAASYSAELATDFGADVRNLIADPGFADIFPGVELSRDRRSKRRLATSHGGAYVAAGIGGSITGRGAHLLLIDDPVKDMAQADSVRWRRRADDWFRSTAFTRLAPDGAIVLIQTRWHEDDLAGRLLERHGRREEGGEWHVLDLPAISPEGEALWPEQFNLTRLERIRASAGPRVWSALFQQKPQPDEGTFFRRDKLIEWEVKPERLNIYGTSDYAVTQDGGDFTVHQVWGVDVEGTLYRLDGWRGQTSSDVWIHRKLDLIRQYRPLAWFGEAGTIQRAVEPLLDRSMNERRIWCKMEWLPSIGDKVARARGFEAMVACGKVLFEPGADFSDYLAFPMGKHDDEVDASSLIGRALDMMHPAIVGVGTGRPPPRNRQESWARRWDRAFEEEDDEEEEWDPDAPVKYVEGSGFPDP